MEEKHRLTTRQKSIIAVTLAIFGFIIIMSSVVGGVFSSIKNADITGAVIGLRDKTDTLADTNELVTSLAAENNLPTDLQDALAKQSQQIKDLQGAVNDTAKKTAGKLFSAARLVT